MVRNASLRLHMAITETDVEFIQNGFQKIKGWCLDRAALVTCCLLRRQAQGGHSGGAFEIGVFEGKFLSVLYHVAREFDLPVVGIDTFAWSDKNLVLGVFSEVFGSNRSLALYQADSRTLRPPDVLGYFGGRKPAFISVDGDHNAAPVCADIELAEAVLAEGGIVAVDDFLNPSAIGVSEGTYRFFFEKPRLLRPFCYSANKLFLAEPRYHEFYRSGIIEFARQRPDLHPNREFVHQLSSTPEYVDQALLGAKVLIS